MYFVERKHNVLGWMKIPFVEHRTKAYCEGYVHAFDSMYPSDPLRIVKIEKDNSTKIVLETKGKEKVHVN